jgi:flagellar motor protein MotB
MSGKILAVVLGVSVLGSVGCTGEFISRHIYERDLNQVKEYNAALERDNAEMRPKADAYDQLKNEMRLSGDADKTYADMAETLRRALAGMEQPVTNTEVIVQGNKVILSDELLNFDLGKFEVTARGKEIIRKLAAAHHTGMFRLVGHTDTKMIKNPHTKEKLITDSNPELSVLRAVAVMGEFLKCGIREDQFASVEGHGWLEPRGDAKTSRRVEIFFVGDAPAPKAGAVKTSAPKAVKK